MGTYFCDDRNRFGNPYTLKNIGINRCLKEEKGLRQKWITKIFIY